MKHAVLILAHNNFSVVKALLEQLDSPNFDIYIHINAKVKSFPEEELKKSVSRAKLKFVKRYKIGYCDYSMVMGVKSLLETASQTYHDYYHLVSGADMMIKKREEFDCFFEENNGKEFVGFSKDYTEERVKYRNFFVAQGRQRSAFLSKLFIKLRKSLITVQKTFGIEYKNIPGFETKKGTDWYSITHLAVEYLLKMEPQFKKGFYYTYCPTEFFAQTLLWNSDFRKNLYCNDTISENRQCVRQIDWDRGSPYVYRMSDKDELLNSKEMFARKFDENNDMEIVNFLKENIK